MARPAPRSAASPRRELFEKIGNLEHTEMNRWAWLLFASGWLMTGAGLVRAADPADGFRPLFNGNDLSGWTVVGPRPEGWAVEKGAILTKGGGSGWLSTEKEYGDFVLRLQFKVTPNGNSGVFIRAVRQGDPAYSGMEIQVLDDRGSAYTKLNPAQYTGSIYGVVAPKGLKGPGDSVERPVGEWNDETIECRGRHVSITLNGVKIVDANLDDYKDKFREHPGLKNAKGYIGLQSHTDRIEFRKLEIKEGAGSR